MVKAPGCGPEDAGSIPASPSRLTLRKQLPDGRWSFETDMGAWIHVTLIEATDMVVQIIDEMRRQQ